MLRRNQTRWLRVGLVEVGRGRVVTEEVTLGFLWGVVFRLVFGCGGKLGHYDSRRRRKRVASKANVGQGRLGDQHGIVEQTVKNH